ncbi:hypothetical protein LZ30DRAFT_788700 [Colletotrichum cereale]|nr:hypothetical protein LZ30DRAFT_788700 [Colletotrichum cereale]
MYACLSVVDGDAAPFGFVKPGPGGNTSTARTYSSPKGPGIGRPVDAPGVPFVGTQPRGMQLVLQDSMPGENCQGGQMQVAIEQRYLQIGREGDGHVRRKTGGVSDETLHRALIPDAGLWVASPWPLVKPRGWLSIHFNACELHGDPSFQSRVYICFSGSHGWLALHRKSKVVKQKPPYCSGEPLQSSLAEFAAMFPGHAQEA